MKLDFDELLTVTFTLFAVIDIVGSIPLLLALKKKLGGIQELKATLVSGALMVLFLYLGEKFLGILGVDKKSFAVAGSIVIFILGILGAIFGKRGSRARSKFPVDSSGNARKAAQINADIQKRIKRTNEATSTPLLHGKSSLNLAASSPKHAPKSFRSPESATTRLRPLAASRLRTSRRWKNSRNTIAWSLSVMAATK